MPAGPSTRPAFFALAALALAQPAAAQPAAIDRTGTGGGPATTITAPNTNRFGVTKPPGIAAGPGPSRREERRERALTDRIESSVCEGCD